jgi:hypothetical protein
MKHSHDIGCPLESSCSAGKKTLRFYNNRSFITVFTKAQLDIILTQLNPVLHLRTTTEPNKISSTKASDSIQAIPLSLMKIYVSARRSDWVGNLHVGNP